MTRTDLEYRKTAADDAGGLGLFIALFDTLAGDLRRAAEAQSQNNLAARSREVSHALLVIGYLEDWVRMGTDGPLAQQLIAYYGAMRRRLVEAEAQQSATLLRQQMESVLELRQHWQAVESRTVSAKPEILAPLPQHPATYAALHEQTGLNNWSA